MIYRWWDVLGQRIKVFLEYKSDHSCLRSTCLHSVTRLFSYRTLSSPPSNVWQFALQRNQSTVITNAITDVIKRSTWIRSNYDIVICLIKLKELTSFDFDFYGLWHQELWLLVVLITFLYQMWHLFKGGANLSKYSHAFNLVCLKSLDSTWQENPSKDSG